MSQRPLLRSVSAHAGLLVAITVMVALSATASAYYTAHGSGSATAHVGTLVAPSITSATPGGGTVALNWSTVTPPGSGAVSYYVKRDGGTASAACPGAAAPTAVTSCTDTGVSIGTHSYTVTALWRSWSGTSASASATVTVGAVSQLVVTTQPSNSTGGTAFATQPVVKAQDANGATVTAYSGTVALSIKGGTGAAGAALSGCDGTLSNGVTTFTGCKIDKAGTGYRLTASDTVRTVDTNTFNVTIGSLAKIAFTTQPAGATGGTNFTTQPKVTGQDAGGNTVTTFNTNVNLSIKAGTGTAGAILDANCDDSRSNGVASFSGCRIDKVGTGYVLVASDGARTAESAPFDVTPGPVVDIVFTTEPAGATVNAPFTTQPVVAGLDAGGNAVPTYAGTITLSIRSGTSGSTLTGCSGTRVNGVTTFSGCKLDKVGSFRLRASDTIDTADTDFFTVNPGPAASLALSAADTTPTAGVGDNLTITALDAFGNTATSYTGTKSLTFAGAGNGPLGTAPTVSNSSGTAVALGTATSINFSSGQATVSASSNGVLTLRKPETATITVTDGTIANGAGLALVVSAGSGTKLAWTSVVASAGTLSTPCFFTCTVTAIGDLGTFTARVSVTDTEGNVVSNLGGSSKTIALSRTSGTGTFQPGSGTTGSLTVPSSGVATSSATFTFRAPSGSWTTTAFQATNGSYSTAAATLSK